MRENGTTFAAELAVEHMIRHLEGKRLLTAAETLQILRGVESELRDARVRETLSSEAAADASKWLGALMKSAAQRSEREPAAIPAEELNASNDE